MNHTDQLVRLYVSTYKAARRMTRRLRAIGALSFAREAEYFAIVSFNKARRVKAMK